MDEIRRLIFSIVCTVILIFGITMFLKNEANTEAHSYVPQPNEVQNAPYKGTTNLQLLTGSALIGMVPHALNGEYVLVIGGITINSNTDIESVDLRNVAHQDYSITVSRLNGATQSIIATPSS